MPDKPKTCKYIQYSVCTRITIAANYSNFIKMKYKWKQSKI